MPAALARHYQGSKGRSPIIDYNEIREHDSWDAKCAKLEYWTAKQIGGKLAAVYPGREWGVDADLRNEMLVITCPSLSLVKGYHLPMNGDTIAELQRRAVRAAGSILERYGVSRGRIIDPMALENLPRTLRDEVIGGSDTRADPMKKPRSL